MVRGMIEASFVICYRCSCGRSHLCGPIGSRARLFGNDRQPRRGQATQADARDHSNSNSETRRHRFSRKGNVESYDLLSREKAAVCVLFSLFSRRCCKRQSERTFSTSLSAAERQQKLRADPTVEIVAFAKNGLVLTPFRERS